MIDSEIPDGAKYVTTDAGTLFRTRKTLLSGTEYANGMIPHK